MVALLNWKIQTKNSKELWALTADKAAALKELQDRLAAAPVLVLTYVEGYFALDLETCSVLAGCILFRDLPDRTAKLVGYWSK